MAIRGTRCKPSEETGGERPIMPAHGNATLAL